ncbi:MAG: YeeE/YedE thiosulfate transporter family protein [Thioalkalispiraceae bacterium]|jgi:uncharacterized membrane protein YedE/YeeE
MFEDPTQWLVVGGLVLGAIFGFITRQFRVCLVNAVSSVSLIKDYRYALLFAVAALVAITGTQLLEIYDIVDIEKAAYRDTRLDWLGVIIGGLIFGIGATLAGGDAARIVILAGNGNHAGWVAVFFFAIFASVAQFGLLESFRVASMLNTSITVTNDAGLATLLSAPSWLVLIVIDVLLIGFIFTQWKKHAEIKLLLAGALLGATVIAAWYTTGVLAVDEFAPPKSPSAMTVSGPMSRTGIMIVAGQYPAFSFSVAFVVALLAISFLVALVTRQFSFTPIKGSVGKVALGGSLMGVGGTLAYGCNIGQGYSGLSTLSLESILAVIAMIAGIHLTTRYLEKNS